MKRSRDNWENRSMGNLIVKRGGGGVRCADIT